MRRLPTPRPFLAVFLGTWLAACGSDAAGPDSPDLAEFAAAISSFAADMEGNQALTSLRTTILPSLSFSPLLLAAIRSSNPNELINPAYLGTTLVWDLTAGRYVIGGATGAPPNGVRLVLYRPQYPDSFSSPPRQPLEVVGRLDVTDQSTTSVARIGIELGMGSVAVGSYTMDGDVLSISFAPFSMNFAAALAGTISDRLAARVATFDSQYEFDLVSTDTSFTFALDAGTVVQTSTGYALDFSVQSPDYVQSYTIDQRIVNGETTLRLTGTVSNSSRVVDVSVSGVTVGRVTGAKGTESVTTEAGQQLTADEREAILAIFRAADSAMNNLIAVSNVNSLVAFP